MRLAQIYWKVQSDWNWAVPAIGMGVLLTVLFKRTELLALQRRPEDLYVLFEVYLPLVAGFWAASLPVLERRNGVSEVHLSYPSWPSQRLLIAAAAPTCAWLATAGVGVWITQAWYVHYRFLAMAAVAGGPTLALSGVAVAAASLARHHLAGIATVSFWCVLDLIAPGLITKNLYLYRVSTPMAGVAPELHSRNLILLGVACWLFALLLSHRRSWWVR